MEYSCKQQQQQQLVPMKSGGRIAEILISLCCCTLLILLFHIVVLAIISQCLYVCCCYFVMKLCSAIMRILFAIISESCTIFFFHLQLFIYNFVVVVFAVVVHKVYVVHASERCVLVIEVGELIWYNMNVVQHVAVTSVNFTEPGEVVKAEGGDKRYTNRQLLLTNSLC